MGGEKEKGGREGRRRDNAFVAAPSGPSTHSGYRTCMVGMQYRKTSARTYVGLCHFNDYLKHLKVHIGWLVQ